MFLKRIILLPLFFISCTVRSPQPKNNIYPLLDGKCDWLKEHFPDDKIIHISKRLIGNQLKCVVESYLQVEDHAIPIDVVDGSDG